MQNDQKNSPSQQELDRFWDISALTPKPRRGQGIRRPESVETVEICSDDSTFGANASNKITLKPDAVRMSERAERSPIKTKMGREMRRCFVAEEGYTLVDADYSQIELRLLAHISNDYNMKEAFVRGDDIHRKTAAAVFGLPEEAVSDDMRKRAKAVNFGIVYGIGGFSLSKDLGISVKEASKYIKNYLMNYPGIDSYLVDVVEQAKKNGYTTTVFGRRRYIPELSAQNGNLRAFGKRIAMNAPIQGTAADIMKLAMIKVYNRLKAENLDARIVMQVHDELVVEAARSDAEQAKRILKEEMENVAELSIPLTVEVTSGVNWLEQA